MHLHLDCFSGIAGDMTLGALVDLGADESAIRAELAKLRLGDVAIEFPRRDAGHGLVGRGVHVEEPAGRLGARPLPRPNPLAPASAATESHTHRPYADIARLVDAAALTPRAHQRAHAIFRRLAEAEARVHGTTVEEVAFHEVGAVDSLVDIVGTAVALDLLDVTSISATPLPLGSGFVMTQHGRLPLPAPATLECLRGVPVYAAGLEGELVTPTGAAIVGALATSFSPFVAMTVRAVGHGAGTRRLPDRPNVLRAVLGHLQSADAEDVWEVSANVDDQSAEELAQAAEAVREAGALDVWLAPLLMKKGRPGHLVAALCTPAARGAVVDAMLRHTSTLGVRLARLSRVVLAREWIDVESPWGVVRVKLGRAADGALLNVAPEADDCARLARAAGVPAKTVRQHALAAALARLAP